MFQIIFLLLVQITINIQQKCTTGYNILVRQTLVNKQGQQSYKLSNKCLCANNYFGPGCTYHIKMSCYLDSLSNFDQINKDNIKPQMEYDINFSVQCWVNHMKTYIGKIQLRQYLSKYNVGNAFGVREQFGQDHEIVWANTTEIFDSNGQLKAVIQNRQKDNYTGLTAQQIREIMVGNNSELYNDPFVYKDYFLGYGLVNGNITYQLKVIDPEYGMKGLTNFTHNDLQITGVKEYLQSYNTPSQINNGKEQFVRNLTDSLNNGKLEDAVKQYFNGGTKTEGITQPIKSDKNKVLPHIRIPVKINPYAQTFYQSIRIQLSVIEEYQQTLNHSIGLNSLMWTIPVKVQGMGLPEPISKHLTVVDSSYKSYYKILVVVIMAICVYFAFSYGYKRYIKWKGKQYTSSSEHQNLQQESLKSASTTSGTHNKNNRVEMIE